MANMININSDELVKFTNKLEKIGRAEMPVTVRATLNEMAFHMKGVSGRRGEIDKSAEREFDFRRNKTLFKAMTGVEKAQGLNIKNMKSEAGIISRTGRDELAQGLADQQKGGKTESGATPLLPSRVGKRLSKKVRKTSFLQNMNAIDLRGKPKNKFVAGAIRSFELKRSIIINSRSGVPLVARVRKVIRRGGKIDLMIDWLYRINKSGTVTLKKKRPFVNRAAINTMKGMPDEFVKQANKRIKKAFEK